MRARRTAAALTAALVAAFAAPAAATAAEPVATHELELGEPLFFDGPESFDEPLLLPSEVRAGLCAAGAPGCLDYRLIVPAGGARLRVALDSNGDVDVAEGEQFGIQLFDPAGREVDSQHAVPDLYYSAELFAEDPEPGAWTVRVVPVAARDADLRLRAKLEPPRAHPTPGGPPREVLPNLRMTPPFEFTLETPADVGSYGFLGLDVAPARGAAPTQGCLPAEIAAYAPRRCLRYSAGPENVGPGRLMLRFVPDGSVASGPSYQRIDRSDGTTVERRAGDYQYHVAHTHYHHRAFGDAQLLRVADPTTGRLEPAGEGPKVGACMGDLRIVDWDSFDNAPEEEAESNCGPAVANDPTAEAHTGVSRGWADIYYYAQEGMYVDLAGNPDGLYVVRVRANDGDVIHETTTADNESYALVEIGGTHVSVLERGYGSDPWDPGKLVVDDGRVPLNADE